MDIGSLQGSNIILIVIDALRARNLGCYGHAGRSSPHVDALADRGIRFRNCFATWNTTDQSLTSILTGRYPRTHGIVHHGDKVTPEDQDIFQRLDVKLLAELLREWRYRTFAVDWMGRWFKRGFDDYGYRSARSFWQQMAYHAVTLPYLHLRYMAANIGLLRLYAGKRKTDLRKNWQDLKDVLRTFRFTFELARVQDAGTVTRLACDLIDRAGRERFFLFLHYWDTHTPYHCPRSYEPGPTRSRNPRQRLSTKYQGAVSYVDHHIGRLLEHLERASLREDTLLIVTSDHGESLTEHDILFDHHGLYDVTTHVPMIWNHPRVFPQAGVIDGLVQHVDILPTLCALLGKENPALDFDGLNLLPLLRGEREEIRDFAFSEESYVQRKLSLRSHAARYIHAPDGVGRCHYCQTVHAGAEELYHLQADPGERRNLAQVEREEAEAMKQKLLLLTARLDEKRMERLGRPGPQHLPAPEADSREMKRIRKKLRSLGYMD